MNGVELYSIIIPHHGVSSNKPCHLSNRVDHRDISAYVLDRYHARALHKAKIVQHVNHLTLGRDISTDQATQDVYEFKFVSATTRNLRVRCQYSMEAHMVHSNRKCHIGLQEVAHDWKMDVGRICPV